jgi:transcriptional regulator with XRE-family HTH domain
MKITPKKIGSRIKRAREAKNWTQFDFATISGCSLSSISRYEAGDLPPLKKRIRLAGLLEIDPHDLVEVERETPTDRDAFTEALVGLRSDVQEMEARILAAIQTQTQAAGVFSTELSEVDDLRREAAKQRAEADRLEAQAHELEEQQRQQRQDQEEAGG